jgi:hypothetical protein
VTIQTIETVDTWQPERPKSPVAMLVLGMHRSGTSAVTRVISLLGADLPQNFYPPADDNPKGYWESAQWIDVHDSALAQLGARWDVPLILDPAWFQSEAAQQVEQRLAELVKTDFSTSPFFVVKDPRICRLMPLWLRVIDRLEAQLRSVLVMRHPGEVIASLTKRNDIQPCVAQLLWVRHTLEAELHSRGHPRSFVLYDRLLSNWEAELVRIGVELGVKWPIAPVTAKGEIESYLSADLRHHKAHAPDIPVNLADSSFVSEVYTAMLAISADDSLLTRTRLDQLRGRLEPFDPLLDDLSRDAMDAQDAARLLQAGVSRRDTEITRLLGVQQRLVSEAGEHVSKLGRLAAETERLSKELNQVDGHLQYRDREIGRLTGEIQRLQSGNESRDSEITRLSGEVERLTLEISQATGHIRYRDSEIAKLMKKFLPQTPKE